MFIVKYIVIRKAMCLVLVVDKGVCEYTGTHDSGVSEIFGVYKLLRVANYNMYYELVIIICMERYEGE